MDNSRRDMNNNITLSYSVVYSHSLIFISQRLNFKSSVSFVLRGICLSRNLLVRLWGILFCLLLSIISLKTLQNNNNNKKVCL